jgi:hypothetical protein
LSPFLAGKKGGRGTGTERRKGIEVYQYRVTDGIWSPFSVGEKGVEELGLKNERE